MGINKKTKHEVMDWLQTQIRKGEGINPKALAVFHPENFASRWAQNSNHIEKTTKEEVEKYSNLLVDEVIRLGKKPRLMKDGQYSITAIQLKNIKPGDFQGELRDLIYDTDATIDFKSITPKELDNFPNGDLLSGEFYQLKFAESKNLDAFEWLFANTDIMDNFEYYKSIKEFASNTKTHNDKTFVDLLIEYGYFDNVGPDEKDRNALYLVSTNFSNKSLSLDDIKKLIPFVFSRKNDMSHTMANLTGVWEKFKDTDSKLFVGIGFDRTMWEELVIIIKKHTKYSIVDFAHFYKDLCIDMPTDLYTSLSDNTGYDDEEAYNEIITIMFSELKELFMF